eukprot:9031914-Heterocapsa_arctica.AAC.1
MGAPRAVQSYFRVSDRDLTHKYSVMRQGVFTFLARGRALGHEGQLQGAPLELDALSSTPFRSPG